MVRLILYNIQYLEGNTGRKLDYLKFWRRVSHPKDLRWNLCMGLKKYKPDILALVEVGGCSFLENEDYLTSIGSGLDMGYNVKKVKYQFKGISKFLKYVPLLNHQANAILSKKKITHYQTLYLKEGMKKVVIDATVEVPQKIVLLLAHLALGEKTREKQFKELAKVVNNIREPVILMGDFNTFGGEKEIKKLLKDTGLEHRYKLKPHKRIYTYPTFHPRRRFDYVLTSKEIKVKKYEVLKLDFSDHLPLMVDFSVKN